MEIIAILALAFIVSLDGLAAGAAYGARKIKLPQVAVVLVSLTSACTMYISMSVGSALRDLFSERFASITGAALLISLGVYFLVQQGKPQPQLICSDAERDILHVRIASLGLVIRVWHDPLLADSDKSGGINPAEAVILGLALALDAFGAGLGAALTGLAPFLTAVFIGLFKFLMVNAGLYTGEYMSRFFAPQVISLLPGILLMVLGVSHLL